MLLGLIAILGLVVMAVEAGAEVDATASGATAEKWWRMVRNEGIEGAPATAEIAIFGYIAADWWDAWLPDDSYPLQFKADLDGLGDVGEIHLRINSGGGDVFSAHTISALLRDHAAKVVSHIDGLAASAATVIALAGNEVIMPGNAMMMIHNPAIARISGDAKELRANADWLDKVRDGILAVYQAKTGMERDALVTLMDSTTWMTAAEAKEMGFVDTVTSPIPVAASVRMGRFVINGTEIDMRGAREWPEALLRGAESGEQRAENADAPGETEEAEPEVPEDGTEGTQETDGTGANGTDGTQETDETGANGTDGTQETDETGANGTDGTQGTDGAPADAVAVERRRVTDILALQVAGAEELIQAAIADGTSAGDVAQAILKSASVRNAAGLAARRSDAPGAVAPEAEQVSGSEKKVSMLTAALLKAKGIVGKG